MSEFDDQKEIIRTIQVLDREAVDEIADTIGSVIERFRQATQTLTAQLDQAQQSKEDAEHSAADMQQRLRLGVKLLKALEERSNELEDLGKSLEDRKQITLEAERKLEEKFAEFDQRMGEAVSNFQQQIQNTSDSILDRASAISELVESAEVNVALMARRVSQTLEQVNEYQSQPLTNTTPSISAASDNAVNSTDTESATIDIVDDDVDAIDSTQQQSEGSELFVAAPLPCPPSISTQEIDELITSGDTLKSELEQLAALCQQLKAAKQATIAEKAQDEDELVEEPDILMAVTQAPSELNAPINRLSALLDQLKQTTLNQQQQRYIKAAEFAVSGMNDIVESAQEHPHIDDRNFELDVENFDLRSCIDEVFALIATSAQEAKVKLVKSIDLDIPANMCGDQGRLIRTLVLAIGQGIKQATLDELALTVTIEYKLENQTNLRFRVKEQRSANAPIAYAKSNPSSTEQSELSNSEFSRGLFGKLIDQMQGDFGFDTTDSEGFSLWFCAIFSKSLDLADDRREHARLPQEELKCNLGEVIDLSLGGMQLRCKRVPKNDSVDIELTSDDLMLSLKGVIVRRKKLGFRKYEVGVQFNDIDPETARLLTEVSLNHWFRPTMGPE